jgi:hypothetical protein
VLDGKQMYLPCAGCLLFNADCSRFVWLSAINGVETAGSQEVVSNLEELDRSLSYGTSHICYMIIDCH